MIWALAFLGSGAVVVLGATLLARHADAIAEATGVGRLWTGSVLLAAATSLPELATDVSAVRLGAPDLAVGDLFGSSMANMLVLAVIDLVSPRRDVLRQAAFDHALAASLAMSLNALAGVLVLVRPEASVLSIGPGSALLFLVYVAGSRVVFRHATRDAAPRVSRDARRGVVRAAVGFGAAALAVLAAAPAFAWSAKNVAEATGLGHTFVGTSLVGLSTSLPELVASIAAVRMGSFDLAVGNLFGSNAFNMAVFVVLDAAQEGSLFATVEPRHAVSALFALVLMSLGMAAIVYRAKRRFAMLEPDSALIVVAYVAAMWMLHRAA
jgi:cation:H+ antiporter